MKNLLRKARAGKHPKRAAGFSLIELLVALAVFGIISAGAVMLVQSHVPLATTVQNQIGLNIAMGNVIAQLQSDAINAGSGYFELLNNTDNPIGMTVINCGNVQTGCNNGGGNDTLNVLAIDLNTPAASVTDSAGNTSGSPPTSCSVTTGTTVYLVPPSTTTASALAANYHQGDYILLLNLTTGGNQFTTTQLTAAGATSGNLVQLSITASNTGGSSKTSGVNSNGTWTTDPFYITSDTQNLTGSSTPRVTDTYCFATGVAVRLGTMISYSVDSNNNLNRTSLVLSGSSSTTTTSVLAQNIIGFKVGSMTFNTGASQDQSAYVFNAPASTPASGCTPTATLDCGFNNDWPLIRSVMVSIIAETPKNVTGAATGGTQQVQAATTIINPRNLSMRDNVNQ